MEEKRKLIERTGREIAELKELLNRLRSIEEDDINKSWIVGSVLELERSEHCFEMYVRNTNL